MSQMDQMIKPGILYRSSFIEDKDNIEDRSFLVSFSSESPVERFFGIEILDHRENSVKLDWLNSGRAPLLLDHDQTKQIGVVEFAKISPDGKARAKIRFGKNGLADSLYNDVVEGIRGNISVGYRYLNDGIKLEEEAKDNNPATYRITSWEPLEISLVSIPADQTVGVGRGNLFEDKIFNMRNNMTKDNDTVLEGNIDNVRATLEQQTVNIRKSEENRITEIIDLGDMHNMRKSAMEYVRDGKSIDSFRKHILDDLSNASAINTSSPDKAIIGMNSKELRSFSILRAIRAAATGNWEDAGLEKEASMAVAKRTGREPGSFFVPVDVTLDRVNTGTRTLEKLTNIAGGYLVETDYLSSNFIDLLRNKMLIKQMGAKVISGLTGDVAIPKQTGGASSFWVSEGMSPNHSQQSFGQVTLSPRSIAAYTDFTRKLILQSSPDIENLVRDDLASVIALEIDRAAISGSGLGAEPPGILSTAGIGKVKFDDNTDPLSWGKIVDLESNIATKNADIGTLGYLCNAAMRGLLKQKEKANGTAQFIWESAGGDKGVGYLNGYKAYTSNQMPADTLLFGNFSDLIIGQWGVLDVMVDPYTLGTSGGIRIRVMQDIDIAIRHVESFAVLKK